MKSRALLLLASLALAGAEVARVEVEGEETCQLCVSLVGAVEEWVEAGDTIDQIVEKVEQLCPQLGIPVSICESLIESWLPIIITDVIEQFLPPCAICYGLRLCETSAEDCVQGATTPDSEKHDWVYIETALDGGRVLTLEPDNHHVWMAHKYGSDDQLWRLEDNGCIRSKSYQDKCLGLETHTNGGQPYLQTDQGVKEQQWYYIDKYLVNQAESSSIWVTNDLSLNVMWADIPLITDGAAVDVQKQDDTTSMKWNLVKP